jgi:hypothetical protein
MLLVCFFIAKLIDKLSHSQIDVPFAKKNLLAGDHLILICIIGMKMFV